jgi:hypothetical protein
VADYFAGWRVHRIPTTELSNSVVWHGRTEELVRLIKATTAHCTCAYGNPRRCGAHQILADQRALDHLAFARTVRRRLVTEEWRVPAGSSVFRLDRLEWPSSTQQSVISEPMWLRAVRSPLAISLIALVLMLAAPLPSPTDPNPSRPIAAWQTR